jgi:tellurite methyltransferase
VTSDLHSQFGDIDIYLFDQLLRGRIAPGMRILDAGCGGGRNLVYLLRNGWNVSAADRDPAAVEQVRSMAATLAPHLSSGNFRVESIEELSFEDEAAEIVIASAVLHFASGHEHFDAMLSALWRVLAPGGLLFARLASSIGIADLVIPLGGGRYRLPDGSDRYLVDEKTLMDAAIRLHGRPADPLKTTIVQNQRAMTTWVVRKGKP